MIKFLIVPSHLRTSPNVIKALAAMASEQGVKVVESIEDPSVVKVMSESTTKACERSVLIESTLKVLKSQPVLLQSDGLRISLRYYSIGRDEGRVTDIGLGMSYFADGRKEPWNWAEDVMKAA